MNVIYFCVITVICAALFILIQKLVIAFVPASVLTCAIIACVCIAMVGFVVFSHLNKNYYSGMLAAIAYFSSFMLFSVFTSVFIDRSLTYHIIFYSAAHGSISEENMNVLFNSAPYKEQRVKDMLNKGYLLKVDGEYQPTDRARYFAKVLMALGEFYKINSTWDSVETEMQSKKD
jgi:membrane-bound ClpP family serine protease